MLKRLASHLPRQRTTEVDRSSIRPYNPDALIGVGRLAASVAPPEKLLAAAVTGIRDGFGLGRVTVDLVDEPGEQVILHVGSDGTISAEARAVDPRSLLGRVIREGNLILQGGQSGLPADTHVGLPMTAGESLVGVLEASTTDGRPFSEEEIAALQAAAHELASAVEQARTAPAPQPPPSESAGLFAQAVREISMAGDLEQIAAILRRYLPDDVSRINLLQVGWDAEGMAVIEGAAIWDRDRRALSENLPPAILNTLSIDEPLIISGLPLSGGATTPLLLAHYMTSVIGVSSVAIFPLSARQRLNGALLLASRTSRRFSGDEVQFLQALATPIGLMFENAALIRLLSRESERLNLMVGLSRSIAASLDMQTLGESLRRALSGIDEITHLSIALAEPDQISGRTITFHGPSLAGQIMLAGTPVEDAIQEHHAVQVQEIADGVLLGMRARGAVQRMLFVPMAARERVIGTLNIGFSSAEELMPDDLQLYEQVAAQLGVAVDNMRLLEQTQAALSESTVLYNTSLSLNAAQTLDEVYHTALSEIAHISGADRIELYIAGPDPRDSLQYVERAAVWADGEMADGGEPLRYSLEEAPILSQFPLSRANLIFNDLAGDRRLDEAVRRRYLQGGARALAVVPLCAGAIWLGALVIQAEKGAGFTTDQIRLTRSIADQATLSIDSHLLLARARRTAVHEQLLREITERLRAAETAEEVLSIAEQELARVLDRSPEALRSMSWGDPSALSPDEWALVTAVGNQVDLAIANISLLESARRTAAQEQMVSDLTARLQTTSTVDDVMQTTVQTLRSMLSDYDIAVRLTPAKKRATGELSYPVQQADEPAEE
ncbi:MAG: hypothetical protein Kow00124_17450 [Anaerolineae bacterium]